MDPLEIRLMNSNPRRQHRLGRYAVSRRRNHAPSLRGLRARVLVAARRLTGWTLQKRLLGQLTPTKRRGRGLAGGFKNVGFSFGFPEHCWAGIELRGSAEIQSRLSSITPAADVGQGAHTALVPDGG